MKILFFSVILVLPIVIVINTDMVHAQFGGPAMGPSVGISDIVASENNVIVSWNGIGPITKSPAAFLRASNDGGLNFGKTINLASFGISPYDLSVSNVKIASSGNNLYLAWNDWTNGAVNSDITFMKSNDGGSTFGKPLKIKTGSGISSVVAIDSRGTNVYVLMSNNTNSAYSDLLFTASHDNGTTFGRLLSLSTNHKLIIGNVQMVSSGNDIYIVAGGDYWGSQNGAVVFFASHDSGKSFVPSTIVDNVMSFTPQVGVAGNDVYITWTQMNGQSSSLFLERSTDSGSSFGSKIQLNQDGDSRWPQIVTSKNNVFVKWVQSLPSGGSRLLFSKSTDNGNTFSAPINLGSFTAGNFDFSYIGILENGDLFAMWTVEYDPSYSHSGVFFRKSTDNGSSFSDIYDINVAGKTAILNPRITSSGNHLYIDGDSGSPGINDIIFRASSDSGVTFTGPVNLNSNESVQSPKSSPLVLIPEFKPDIPTSVPANSKFADSQNASFVLGQPDFVSNSANPTASTFSTPHFIVLDSQGDLWVSDGGNDRVLEFKTPFVIGENASVVLGQSDFTSWQVLNGTNPKSLWHPQGLVFDSQGNLWVADGGSNRVLEFMPPFRTGQEPSLVLGHKDFTSDEQTSPPSKSSTYYPEGITFDPDGNLWVADTSGRLLEFKPPFSDGKDASLVLQNLSNAGGITSSTVSAPFGITFDKTGNLWVADSGNYRLLRFDKPFSNNQAASLVLGHKDFTTGGEGVSSNASSFRDPYGITFDSQGNLWVTDSGNNRVLEFIPPFTNGERASLILGQTSFNAGAIDTGGHTAGTLDQPHGIAFDAAGNLWVADSTNNRILVYKSNTSKNSQIVFPNFGPAYQSIQNTNSTNAYEQAANKMAECSKKLGIASDNQTAINLVLGSYEFQSKVRGFDFKPNGIANSFHLCTLDTVDVIYALYDKDSKYVKSLYVSVDPSLTKILGIKEEMVGVQYGGPNVSLTPLPLKQFKSGVAAQDVQCSDDLVHIIKAEDGSPACVNPDSLPKLVLWNWAQNPLPGFFNKFSSKEKNELFYKVMNIQGLKDWSKTGWRYIGADHIFSDVTGEQLESTIELTLPPGKGNPLLKCPDSRGWFARVEVNMTTLDIMNAWIPDVKTANCEKPNNGPVVLNNQTESIQKMSGNLTSEANKTSFLRLYLSADAYTNPAEPLGVDISLNNTSSQQLILTKANDWVRNDLSVGPCSYLPFGIAVLKGYYTEQNMTNVSSLVLYPNYPCPRPPSITGYTFQAMSDMVTQECNDLFGCPGKVEMKSHLSINGFLDNNGQHRPFNTGIYTVVAGDEWGHVFIQHFTVTNTTPYSTATNQPFTVPANDIRGTIAYVFPSIHLTEIASSSTGSYISRGGGLDSYDYDSIKLELYHGKKDDSHIIAATVENVGKRTAHIYVINIVGWIPITNSTAQYNIDVLQARSEIIPKEDAILGSGESQTKYIVGNWVMMGRPVIGFSTSIMYSYENLLDYNGATNGYDISLPVQWIQQ
jgi:sugar lactone lactonase YvrE